MQCGLRDTRNHCQARRPNLPASIDHPRRTLVRVWRYSSLMNMGHRDPDRYQAALSSLSPEQRGLADATLATAAATFASFEDAPESRYYEARELTPEQTWQAITAEVARVTAIVAAEAEAQEWLTAADFDGIHQGIFGPVFGDSVLSMRRFDEQVTYGTVIGPKDKPRNVSQDGKSAKGLAKSLATIAKDLNIAFRERDAAVARREQRTIFDATLPAATAYGRFLADHPYFDGNGRTAFPLLNFALIRLGLVAVAVPETQQFHWCLGRAMHRRDRDARPLAEYLGELIRSSEQLDGIDSRE